MNRMQGKRQDAREVPASLIGSSGLMDRLLYVRRRKLAYGGLVASRLSGRFPAVSRRRR